MIRKIRLVKFHQLLLLQPLLDPMASNWTTRVTSIILFMPLYIIIKCKKYFKKKKIAFKHDGISLPLIWVYFVFYLNSKRIKLKNNVKIYYEKFYHIIFINHFQKWNLRGENNNHYSKIFKINPINLNFSLYV